MIASREPDVVDLSTLFAAASTGAVLLGLIIGVRELRHFTKVREAEVLRVMTDKTTDAEFLRGFFLLTRTKNKTYDQIIGTLEEVALFQWLDFLETLGLLTKRGVVSIGVIDDHLHGAIRLVWSGTEPLVRSYREEYKHPEFGEWAEYLYLRIYGAGDAQMRRASQLEERLYAKRLK